MALSSMGNSDLISGIGGIDAVKGVSYEQAVIESHIWEHVRGFMRRFEISDETIALDVVKQVGHGNTFLSHVHTARNFKKELFFFDEAKKDWERTYSDAMVPEAKEIAKRILREHEVPSLDGDMKRQGDEIIAAYEKNIGV